MQQPKVDPNKLLQFGVDYTTSAGAKVTLLWTHSAMMRAEREGLGLPTTGQFTSQVILLWALMLYKRPTTTIDQVAEFLDTELSLGRLNLIDAACSEALKKAGVQAQQPVEVTEDPSEPPAAA
jgi:hypothetical protein